MATKTHERRLMTRRELLAHRRNQQELGFDFPLNATSLGLPEDEQLKARVRRISLNSQASINQIPSHLQDTVNAGLDEVERVSKLAREEGANTDTLRDRISNNEKILPAANAYCLATFLEPRLVEYEQDASETDDVWWVEDIDADDRLDLFYANLNADSAAAKKFRIHRPQRPIDVESRPVESAYRRETAQSAEAPVVEVL